MVTWFVFAPEGGQSWITAQGPAVGMQAVLPAYQMSGPGARFPPAFDRTNVHADPWGTLTLRFSDCNRGRVAWVSSVPGYGSGILEIERLTLPAGLVCTEGTGSNAAEADDMPSEFPLR
jgi:hypothetical protein